MTEPTQALRDLISAWESLPPGRYRGGEIQRWLSDHMKPAIDKARLVVGELTKGGET